MKIFKKSICIIIILLVTTGCNMDNFDYKYANKADFFNCQHQHSLLLKEALYTFESDITNYYGKFNPDPVLVYSTFIIKGVKGTAKYNRLVSPHALKVFEALKKIEGLWDKNGKNSKLNYNSDIIECIAKNIKDDDLKTTFKSLISVNSMSPMQFGYPLVPKYQQLITDKHLALYAALDLYYERLFYADLSENAHKKKTTKNTEEKVEDHSGHNH